MKIMEHTKLLTVKEGEHYKHFLKFKNEKDEQYYIIVNTTRATIDLSKDLLPGNYKVYENSLKFINSICDIDNRTHYECATKKKSIYFNNDFIFVESGIKKDEDSCSVNLGCSCSPEYEEFSTEALASFNTKTGVMYIKNLKDNMELLR